MLGIALATVSTSGVALFAPLGLAFWVTLSLGVSGLVLGSASFVRRKKIPPVSFAIDIFAVSLALRVATLFPEWTWRTGSRVFLARHFDLLYHLAIVKELLRSGVPLTQSPMLQGAPAGSYHVGFDAFVASVLAALPVPVDAGYFHILQPGIFGIFLISAGVAASAIARLRTASLPALVLLFATYGAPRFDIGAPSWGVRTLDYLEHNPPAALGGAFAASALVLVVASAESRQPPTWSLFLAGAVSSASLLVKANLAIALVPAFVAVVVVGVVRRWWSLRAALFSAAGSAAAGVLALVVIGSGAGEAGIGVDVGAYARWAAQTAETLAPGSWMSNSMAALLSTGVVGTFLALLLYLAAEVVGVSGVFLPAWLLPSARRGVSHAGLTFVGLFVVAVLIVALTLVQPDAGRFTPWNIAAHTAANLFWGAVAVGAAGLCRAVYSRGQRELFLVLLATVLLTASAAYAIRIPNPSRGRLRGVRPSYFHVVRRLADLTEPSDVVAQRSYLDTVSWVSGIGGRRVVLERASSMQATRRDEVIRRRRLLDRLFEEPNPEKAKSIAKELGATVAIVDTSRDATGALTAGDRLFAKGRYVLVRLAPPAGPGQE